MLTVRSSIIASALLILSQLTKRLISIVSMVILARILEPADFGLVAISLLFMNFVQVVSTTGGGQYLLSREKLTDDMVFTSWTLNFLIKGFLVLILAISSVFISQYYEDPRLTPLILVMATQLLIESVGSPGMTYKRKKQELGAITKWDVKIKVFTAALTIIVAYVYESYWALVIGQFTSALIHMISTYIIAPLRPKFTLVNFKEQWSFTKWILPQSLVNFFRSQIDAIFVSSWFDKASFGAYNSMRYYATIPADVFIKPGITPLLTQFSEFKSNQNYFLSQSQVVFVVLVAICTPTIYFMQQHAEFAINLVLGSKWVAYYPLFSAFAFLTVIVAFNHFLSQLLMLKDKTKFLFLYSIFSTLIQIVLFITVEFDSIFELAQYKIAVDIFSVAVLFFIVIKFIFSVKQVLVMILLAAPSVIFILIAHYIFIRIISIYDFGEMMYFITNVIFVTLIYIVLLISLISILKSRVASFHYLYNLLVKRALNRFYLSKSNKQ